MFLHIPFKNNLFQKLFKAFLYFLSQRQIKVCAKNKLKLFSKFWTKAEVAKAATRFKRMPGSDILKHLYPSPSLYLSLSLTHTHTHTHTNKLTQARMHSFSYTYSNTLFLSHTHILTRTHSLYPISAFPKIELGLFDENEEIKSLRK